MAGRFENEPTDIKYAIEERKDPIIPKALTYIEIKEEVKEQFGGKIPDEADTMDRGIFEKVMSTRVNEEQVKYNKRVKTLKDNKVKVISAALAQCDEGTIRAIERSEEYETKKGDLYWVLKTIRTVSRSSTSSAPDNLERSYQLMTSLHNCRQGRSTLSNYYNRFTGIIQAMEDEDAAPVIPRITNKANVWKPSVTAGSSEAAKVGQDAYFAHVFIQNANYVDFNDWRVNLARSVESQGEGTRPATVQAAYQRLEKELVRFGRDVNQQGSGSRSRNEGTVMALTSNRQNTSGSGSSGRSGGSQGRASGNRGSSGTASEGDNRGPNEGDGENSNRNSEQGANEGARSGRRSVSAHCIDATNLAQRLHVKISPDLIVIDSASSCHIFMSNSMVSDIVNHSQAGISDPLILHSNGGSMECADVGKFENLEEYVWFDKRSIANILSLALLVKERRVFFDSAVLNEFLVFRGDGSFFWFYCFILCHGFNSSISQRMIYHFNGGSVLCTVPISKFKNLKSKSSRVIQNFEK